MSTNTKGNRPPFQGIDMFSTALPLSDSWIQPDFSKPTTRPMGITDIDQPLSPAPVIIPRGMYFNPSSHSYSTALPAADAFQGTGLGLYLDPFHNNHNMVKVFDDNFRRALFRDWFTMGCRLFHVSESVVSMQSSISFGLNALYQYLNSISRVSDVKIIVNSELNCMTMRGTGDWLGIPLANIHRALRASAYSSPRITFDAIYIDEPEYCIHDHPLSGNDAIAELTLFLQRLHEALRALEPLGLGILLTTYDINIIAAIMARFANEIRTDRLILCPDNYYIGSFQSRQWFWREVAEYADSNGIPRERIRPTISPQCDFCGSDPANAYRTNPKCVPQWLTWDYVLFSQLGFAGPFLYLGNGISQQFYEYAMVSSWLTGCMPLRKGNVLRPRSYGEMQDLISDPMQVENIAMQLSQDHRISPTVHENHLSCTQYCNNGSMMVHRNALCTGPGVQNLCMHSQTRCP